MKIVKRNAGNKGVNFGDGLRCFFTQRRVCADRYFLALCFMMRRKEINSVNFFVRMLYASISCKLMKKD